MSQIQGSEPPWYLDPLLSSVQTMLTQSSGVSPKVFTFGSMGHKPANNDKATLPSWLHGLFTQEITDLKQCFTHSLVKPSRIREKYLAALLKHSPTQHDCPTCLMVHARDGEKYCVELEQRLTQARNPVSASSQLPMSLGETDGPGLHLNKLFTGTGFFPRS